MASLHQRNRIVVFRLSQEEYNRLRSACLVAGGRNLSDYTRTELLSSLRSDSRDSLIEQKFRVTVQVPMVVEFGGGGGWAQAGAGDGNERQ